MDAMTGSFEDTCEVYTMSGETPFSAGVRTVAYSGPCRIYSASYIRTFERSGVVRRDYAVDIQGRHPEILAGMSVDVTHMGNAIRGMLVTGADCAGYGERYGTTLYVNVSEN